MRLTDISVRALKAPGRGQITYSDDALAGFGVRVSQGGTKTFVVVHGPTRRRITIGRFPIIGLADARAEAKRILAEETLGKHRPRTISFDAAKYEFLAASKRKHRATTHRDYVRLMKRFVFGKTKLGDIGKHDVKRKLDQLVKTPSEHRHALVAIKTFFRWAVREGYLDHSPIEGLQPLAAAKSRERALSSHELRAVLRASLLEAYPFGPIVALCVLTGQRRGEVAALRWEWIDEGARTITLPASVTKNKRVHTFPYGVLVADIFETVPRLIESPCLFPASRQHVRGTPTTIFNGWGKAKATFDAKLEGVAPYRLHDLRRTFATTMASLGVPQIVVEKLLNHVSGGTQSPIAQVYNRHSYLDEMRDAIGTYEAFLEGLLSNKSDVVPGSEEAGPAR